MQPNDAIDTIPQLSHSIVVGLRAGSWLITIIFGM